MTKISVDEMPAGSMMDMAIAEILGTEHWETIYHYSTDISLAWTLLDEMEASIYKESGGSIFCMIRPEYGFCMELLSSKAQGVGKTVPLAICRAFLKAHDVTEIEVT